MEYIALGVSLITLVFLILTFFFNRNNDSKKDIKEDSKEEKEETKDSSYKWGVVNTKLDSLEKNVSKILDKLDVSDKEVDEKIEKAIEKHERIYHSKEQK